LPKLNRSALLLVLIAIIKLPLISVSAQVEQKWLTYKNPDFGFSLQYPSNWNITTFNNSMLDVTHNIVNFNTVNASVGISSEELFSNTTAKEQAREKYNKLKEFVYFQRINDGSLVIDDRIPAWKLEYQMNLPDFTGKATEIWFINDNMVFEIEFTSGNPNDYSKNLPVFQKMIRTFHLT
jgi:hypothetical protein